MEENSGRVARFEKRHRWGFAKELHKSQGVGVVFRAGTRRTDALLFDFDGRDLQERRAALLPAHAQPKFDE
jgi:hypothetical protein